MHAIREGREQQQAELLRFTAVSLDPPLVVAHDRACGAGGLQVTMGAATSRQGQTGNHDDEES